jgi:translation initiation factor IF-3
MQKHKINKLIKAEKVRVIVSGDSAEDDDKMIGILPIAEALAGLLAEDSQLSVRVLHRDLGRE